MKRVCLPTLLVVTAAILATATFSGLVSGQSAPALAKDGAGKLMREGTKLEPQVATCRSNGERLVVELGDQRNMLALENLSAQRIMEAIHNEPNDKYWSVNGTVTEFQGRNFLLLQRVTRATKSTKR